MMTNEIKKKNATIIQEDDFKILKESLAFFNTSIKQVEQSTRLFEKPYYEIHDLTMKEFRAMMATFDKILFGLDDDAELSDDISSDDLERNW